MGSRKTIGSDFAGSAIGGVDSTSGDGEDEKLISSTLRTEISDGGMRGEGVAE